MAQRRQAKDKRKEYSQTGGSPESLDRDMRSLQSAYNKKFNKENSMTAVRASDLAAMEMIQPVTTGHISFDLMTGIGGLPCGKIIEFTGEEGTNKSTFAWECVGAVHHNDPYAYCVWIDAEKAIDVRVPGQRRHILNMGVDLNRLFICVPDMAEDCWEMVMMACDNNATLVVIDSVSALIPKREFEADFDKDGYPALPASINKGFRKISTNLFMTGTTLIEINQVRENLDVAGQRYVRFEDRWKTTGGKGLKHWLTLRLFFKKKKIWSDEKVHIGDEVTVKVIKTRLSPVKADAHMFMYSSSGFDKVEELITLAVEWEVLYKKKPTSRQLFWDGYEDHLGGMSNSEWYDYLKENEDAYQMLADAVAATYNAYYDEDVEVNADADAQESEDDDESEDED